MTMRANHIPPLDYQQSARHMNKIFSKVWNKKLGRLVVASEHARAGGRKGGNGRARTPALLTVLGGSLLLLNTAGAATIATPIQAQNGTETADASATATDSTAAGAGSSATSTGATAFGAGSTASGGANTVIGFNATSTGAGWAISNLSNRRADGLGVNITSDMDIAAGVAVGKGANAGVNAGTALGSHASSGGLGAIAVGAYSSAAGRNAIAQGSAAYAGGLQSMAIGSFSAAAADRATAIGTTSTAAGTDSNAIGTSADARGERAIALGSAKTVTLNVDAQQNTIDNTQATGMDSIAIGTDSRATATNAISIGGSSRASANNSVALGAGSTTTADLSAAGYNPGSSVLAGAASAASGEVSVGATGQERRVTNVAAGSAETDAVNVSQLQSEAAKTARSGTSAAVALGGGATYGTDGTISAPSYQIGGTTFTNVGSALTNIDARTTTNAINITNNTTAITHLSEGLASGEVGLVRQSAASADLTVGADTDGAALSVAGTAGNRTVTGVGVGSLSATSTDAVNGSQLFATNARLGTAETTVSALQATVEGNSSSISNLTQSLADGGLGLVNQDGTSKLITVAADKGGAVVDFSGNEGVRTLTGLKTSGADADAANVAQLKGMVAGLGGSAAVNADGSITAPSYLVEKNADGTGGTILHTAGDAITNLDARTSTNSTAITRLSESLTNGVLGLVQQDEDSRAITVANSTDGASVNFNGTVGARVLEGVAVGAVNASSLQAINGSQLYGLGQSIASYLGGGSLVNANGTISAPSYSVGGTLVTTVGDAIGNLDVRTSQNSRDIASLKDGIEGMDGNLGGITSQITGISTDISGLDNRVTHLESAITSVGFGDSGLVSANIEGGSSKVASTSGSDTLAVGNASAASGDNSIVLGNNAKAVNINSVALGNGSVADRDNSVSVGTQGNERQVANVAAGTQDTDAVNVGQLKQSVRYDQNPDGSTNLNHVTLGQGTPVTMSNLASGRVAAGSADAINGSQMYDWTMNRDNRFSNASLSHRIDGLERDMQAGVATALAARQAPYVAGKATYAVGAAGYKSQGAVGISTRYTAESGRWSLEGGFAKSGDGTGVYMGMSGVLGD